MRFVHIPTQTGGVITAAYQHDQEKGAENQTLTVALAFCNPTDNFDKAKGRLIASGRFGKSKTHTIPYHTDQKNPIQYSVKKFLTEEFSEKDYPILLTERRFNDDGVNPRWIQYELMEEMSYQAMRGFASLMPNGMTTMPTHTCDDPDCTTLGSGNCGDAGCDVCEEDAGE